MRILHVTHQYLPDRRGGVEVYTEALAQAQAAAGHTVAVVHGWADRVNDAPLLEQGPGEQGSGGAGGQGGLTVWAATARAARHPLELFVRSFHNPTFDHAFSAVLRDFRPAVVHVQHLKGLSARLPHLAQAQGVPVVWTLHDWWTFCGNAQLVRHTGKLCGGPRLWLNCADCAAHHGGVALNSIQTGAALAASPLVAALFGYRARLLRQAYEAANVLIAPSAFVRDRFAEQGFATDCVRVVPFGRLPTEVGATGFRPSPSVPHPLRVGYLGGLAWQKGVHVLIEAFNTLPNGAATLTVYGDPRPFPDYVARLRALARHSGIRFAGPYAPSARDEVLAGLDVVVVPSLWPETFNLVSQEALAAGVPVVASHVGALGERVQDGVAGRLFPPGDRAALAAILRDLAANPDTLNRLRAGIPPQPTFADHQAAITQIYASLMHL